MDAINFETIFAIIGATLTGLITILMVLAPITRTNVDNRILSALRWVQDNVLALLKTIVLPRRLR